MEKKRSIAAKNMSEKLEKELERELISWAQVFLKSYRSIRIYNLIMVGGTGWPSVLSFTVNTLT